MTTHVTIGRRLAVAPVVHSIHDQTASISLSGDAVEARVVSAVSPKITLWYDLFDLKVRPVHSRSGWRRARGAGRFRDVAAVRV
jgi:hypothetical protein